MGIKVVLLKNILLMAAWGVSDHDRLVTYLRSPGIVFESSQMKVLRSIPQKHCCRFTLNLLVQCMCELRFQVDALIYSMLKTSLCKSMFELTMPVLPNALSRAWMRLEHGTRVTWHNFLITYQLSQETRKILWM